MFEQITDKYAYRPLQFSDLCKVTEFKQQERLSEPEFCTRISVRGLQAMRSLLTAVLHICHLPLAYVTKKVVIGTFKGDGEH
jgi:hypothetical protein